MQTQSAGRVALSACRPGRVRPYFRPMTRVIEPIGSRESVLRRRLWRAAWGLLLAALGLLLFARGVTRTDEGRYAETAREMILPGGDAWQMRLMGVRYYEKPPMLYWMSAASMKLLGVHAGAARLPLLISIAATLGLCFWGSRRAWGAEAAWGGAAVLLSSLGCLVSMGVLLTDSPLVMFFTATCLFLREAYRPGRRRVWPWLLAAAGAAGCGVLTKGFLAVVLPGAIVFVWLLWERRLRDLWRWSLLPIGGLFALALAAALAQIEWSNPGFAFRFVVQEHFQRFVGTRQIQGHPEPVWFYLPVLVLLLVPWSLFAPRAIRGLRARGDLKGDSFTRFLVVWASGVFVFFTASSGKLPTYLMPMVPPMALLIARRGLLEPVADAVDRRLWAVGAWVPLVGSVGVAVFWALGQAGAIDKDFGAPGWLVAVPVGLAVAVSLWVGRAGRWKTFPGLLLAAAAATFAFACLDSPLASPDFRAGFRDHAPFFREVRRIVGPQDGLILCQKHAPALAFHVERIPWLYRVRNELGAGMDMEPGLPGIFTSSLALDAEMEKGEFREYYAVLLKKHRSQLALQGLRFDPEILAEDHEMVLHRLRRL